MVAAASVSGYPPTPGRGWRTIRGVIVVAAALLAVAPLSLIGDSAAAPPGPPTIDIPTAVQEGETITVQVAVLEFGPGDPAMGRTVYLYDDVWGVDALYYIDDALVPDSEENGIVCGLVWPTVEASLNLECVMTPPEGAVAGTNTIYVEAYYDFNAHGESEQSFDYVPVVASGDQALEDIRTMVGWGLGMGLFGLVGGILWATFGRRA